MTHEVLDLLFAYQVRTTKKKKKKTSTSHHLQARPCDNGQMTARRPYGEEKGERKIWMHSAAGVQNQLPKLAHALAFSISLCLLQLPLRVCTRVGGKGVRRS